MSVRIQAMAILATCLLPSLGLGLFACAGGAGAVRAGQAEAEPACTSAALLPAVVLLADGMASIGGGDPTSASAALELLTSSACRQAGAGALALLAELHMARRMIGAGRGQQALDHLARARARAAAYGPAVDKALRRLESEAYEVTGDTYRAAAALEDDPWLDRLIEERDRP